MITASVRKVEFEPLQETFPLEAIKLAAKKCLGGLGTKIKFPNRIPSTILKKIPLTSSGGAGRAVFMLQVVDDKAILLMIKLKNDKKVGENMSFENRKFGKVFDKNLAAVMKDIENDNYEEFDL